ncbi:MAG: DUF3472 domain-containing protein [Planctomycetes bacterium]|nr:DUF3472 domain-containing protein [Planctomycetota bacterium]
MRRTRSLLAAVLPLLAQLPSQEPTLRIPAFTGYAHPDPDAMRRRDDGTVIRCDGALHFYVHFATTGSLQVQLEAEARNATAPAFATRVHPNGCPATPDVTSTTDDLGTFPIATTGWHLIRIAHQDDSPLRELRALVLRGTATANAHANIAERRNAASVHLGYPVPKEHRDDVEWFYVEVTPKTDPLWTYYMATGWHRGYFGMQVNSERERRLIFSVWDAGDEANDRGKVAADNRVTLVAKGENVHAGDFGNEGTGGHSHLVHDWRLGDTFRFLLHARPDGNATIYSGWFWFAAEKRWGLIASFRAPKDGKRPRGLYSFSENFSGANGDAARECEFGNAWVRTAAGAWLRLDRAGFTHDETGLHVRPDRWASVRDDRFVLHHGSFTTPPATAVSQAHGGELHLPAGVGKPPTDAELPIPPATKR